MQIVIATVIVLAAAGYLAWVWAPRRKAVTTDGAADSCGSCTGCSGCSRG